MSNTVLTKSYSEPEICEKEILRYAGCKEPAEEVTALLKDCLSQVHDKLIYKICYIELSVSVFDDLCDFGILKVKSKNLATNLKGCNKAVLFAATVGSALDRLISKYSRISPSKALMLESIGNERIEALCDRFCEELAGLHNAALAPRFSAGYGDLPLDIQKEIFSLLDCPRKIGLTLTDSLLMSPSKSVTAFVGIKQR